jgi:hypothetical protein
MCVEFYYHMYGISTGALNVYLKTNNGLGTSVFSKSGTAGDKNHLCLNFFATSCVHARSA